jgi:predicted nucleotide-binding protein
MPTKDTTYPRVRFPVETIQHAFEVFGNVASESWREQAKIYESQSHRDEPETLSYLTDLSISADNTKWTFNSSDEFYAELRKPHAAAQYSFNTSSRLLSECMVRVYENEYNSEVSIRHPIRGMVERISAIFDAAAPGLTAPEPTPAALPRPRVFIGHGGASTQWRDLKDHLQDMHAYDVTTYETGARAGHTIRDVLGEMLEDSSFAVLVMSAEDVQHDQSVRARQNVVHEAGLFQGRLGFSRAIILLEEGTDTFSNIDGVQYVPFSRNNIRETFGDVLATLRREFPS